MPGHDAVVGAAWAQNRSNLFLRALGCIYTFTKFFTQGYRTYPGTGLDYGRSGVFCLKDDWCQSGNTG